MSSWWHNPNTGTERQAGSGSYPPGVAPDWGLGERRRWLRWCPREVARSGKDEQRRPHQNTKLAALSMVVQGDPIGRGKTESARVADASCCSARLEQENSVRNPYMAGVRRGTHQNTKLAALSKEMQEAPVVSTASAMSPASVALPYWSCSCIWIATSSPAVHRPSAAAPRSTACSRSGFNSHSSEAATCRVFVRDSETVFLCS